MVVLWESAGDAAGTRETERDQTAKLKGFQHEEGQSDRSL